MSKLSPQPTPEHTMINNNSPLEHLAAFAMTLVVGIVSTVALGKYIEKVRNDAANGASGTVR
jgi:hypothetical protein